jgi:tetratricopeptide (TPR) repeat protein
MGSGALGKHPLWLTALLAAALASAVGCGPAPAAQAAIHVPDAPTGDAPANTPPGEEGADDDASPAGEAKMSSATGQLSKQERNARTKALYKRGIAAQDAGRYKEAIDLYHQANRMVEGAMPKLKIAQCLEALGEIEQAKRYYEIFITEAPATGSYPEKVEDARKRLDGLNQSSPSPKAAKPTP